MNYENFVWAEKYRPKVLENCVLPPRLKSRFSELVAGGELPNMLFVGPPGTGKTTLAKVLAETMEMDYLYINASKDSGVEVLRTQIQDFVVTLSLENSKKIVLLDEADGVSPHFQRAFRAFIEEFSQSCRFILTCNYPNLIIPALQSRLDYVDFTIKENEKREVGKSLVGRLKTILNEENIEFDLNVLKKVVVRHFPDYRKIIGELQANSYDGKLQLSVLSSTSDESIDELLGLLREKQFNRMRQWVAINRDIDLVELQRTLYNRIDNVLHTECVPEFILMCSEYQYRKATMVDLEIHTAAFLTELMKLNWK